MIAIAVLAEDIYCLPARYLPAFTSVSWFDFLSVLLRVSVCLG